MNGFVYFVAAPTARRVKIGFCSGDPRKRLYGLQTGSPEELYLVAHAPGSREDERYLHQCLSGFRDQGEWFRYQGEVAHILTHLTWWTYDSYCEMLLDEDPDSLLDCGDGSEPMPWEELIDFAQTAGTAAEDRRSLVLACGGAGVMLGDAS